jgi:hypothetical protein
MAVLAATALTTGTYDPQTLSAAKATIRTRNLVRTLAARHRADNTDTATRGGKRLAVRTARYRPTGCSARSWTPPGKTTWLPCRLGRLTG